MSPLIQTTGDRVWFGDNHRGSPLPPLVLLHGAGGNHLFWPPQLRDLPDCSVLAPDLPGHGRSEGHGLDSIAEYASAVVGFLDAADVEQAVLCGHSMGGAIALWLALEHPLRVAGLILVNTGARLRVLPAVLDGLSTAPETTLALIAAWCFGPDPSDELRRLGARSMQEANASVSRRDLLACDQFDVRDRLSEIRAPTLVIGSTADRMTPLKYSQYLAEKIPGARLQEVDGAGHMVALEQPDAVAAAVQGFVKQLR